MAGVVSVSGAYCADALRVDRATVGPVTAPTAPPATAPTARDSTDAGADRSAADAFLGGGAGRRREGEERNESEASS